MCVGVCVYTHISILLQDHNSPHVSSMYIIQPNYTPYNFLTSNILYSWIFYYIIREFQPKIMTFNGGVI